GKTLAGFLPTLVELSSPLPLRSGGVRGEQSPLSRVGGGGVATRSHADLEFAEAPPTPNPSPPRAPRAGGGEKKAAPPRPDFISTGRSVQRSRGFHKLYNFPPEM